VPNRLAGRGAIRLLDPAALASRPWPTIGTVPIVWRFRFLQLWLSRTTVLAHPESRQWLETSGNAGRIHQRRLTESHDMSLLRLR
jgi:hypothetical protein